MQKEELKEVKKEVSGDENKESEKKLSSQVFSLEDLKTNRPWLHYPLTQLGINNDAELNEIFELVPKWANEGETQDKLIAFLMAKLESVWGKSFNDFKYQLKIYNWWASQSNANDSALEKQIQQKEQGEKNTANTNLSNQEF